MEISQFFEEHDAMKNKAISTGEIQWMNEPAAGGSNRCDECGEWRWCDEYDGILPDGTGAGWSVCNECFDKHHPPTWAEWQATKAKCDRADVERELAMISDDERAEITETTTTDSDMPF